MIKFFRHIRRSLINQNQMGKYFKYAIGEILLVVIGILIALQINNWNNYQKDLEKEQKILRQLKEEYTKNLAQLQQKITMRNDMITAASKVLNYIDQPTTVTKDSLLHYLNYIETDPTFDPIKNDLIESGNLHLIRNDSLKQRLSNWTSDVYQVQENELEWQKFRTEVVLTYTVKNGLARDLSNNLWKNGYTPIHALDQNINLKTKVGPSKHSGSVTELLNSVELEGIAAMAITWSNIANIQSLALQQNIIEIVQLIDGEIKE